MKRTARGLVALAGMAFIAGNVLSVERGAPAAVITWRLDRLQFKGGGHVQVLGRPAFAELDGARALRFDGAADGLLVPVVPLAGRNAFTIEACFRPESGGPAEQRFFHTEDEAGSRALLEIRLNDGQWALDTFLRSGENSLPLLDREKLHAADRWHWVALAYDGRTMRAFVNGALELSGDVAFAPMKAAGQTSLGVRQNRVYWFKGGLRELRFHSRALSAEELQR